MTITVLSPTTITRWLFIPDGNCLVLQCKISFKSILYCYDVILRKFWEPNFNSNAERYTKIWIDLRASFIHFGKLTNSDILLHVISSAKFNINNSTRVIFRYDWVNIALQLLNVGLFSKPRISPTNDLLILLWHCTLAPSCTFSWKLRRFRSTALFDPIIDKSSIRQSPLVLQLYLVAVWDLP